MIKRRARVNAILIYLADIVLAIFSFYLAYFIRDSLMLSYERLAPLAQYQWLLLFIIPVWSLAFYIAGCYRFSHKSTSFKELLRVWLAIAVSIVLLAFVVFVFKSIYFSRLFLAVFAVVNVVCITFERIIASWYFKKIRVTAQNVRNVIIVGTGERAEVIAGKIRNHKGWGLNFLGYVSEGNDARAEPGGINGPCLGTIGEIEDIVRRHVVNEVIFVISKERLESLEDVFLFLEDEGINARLELNLFKHVIAKVHLDELDDVPLLTYSTVPTNEFALAVKRVLDVAISVVALTALSPVIGLIAALIRLTSKGPVLFVQTRCGLNGRPFDFYKFRSMYTGTEAKRTGELDSLNELDGPVFKMKRDPRVTTIGRVLRKTSLDEFPQLYNVLKGDMSIVGPRPPIPDEVAKYERWQRRRLSMKPGLTCIWQVSGRNAIKFQDWMRLDLLYIDNWSLWLDLKILFKTIPAVLSGRGAY